jgi:hypothetical protein
MKTMTCQSLGGPCEQKLSAGSWNEMVQAMTKHIKKRGHSRNSPVFGELQRLLSISRNNYIRQASSNFQLQLLAGNFSPVIILLCGRCAED